jgi:carbon-monoxide dehydrogenase medium subunit
MKPGPLQYHRAPTLADAVARLAEAGSENRVLAGGQSLIPMLNLRLVAVDCLVDITSIPQMRSAEDDGNEVFLGACVTHDDVQSGRVPDPSNGLMPWVASRIAYQAVRNRGTIGGSLALADPAADWVTTMAALGATIEWHGPDGPQSCSAEEFVSAAYRTRLRSSDILTRIAIPRMHPEAKWGCYKLSRKMGEFAHAMAVVIRARDTTRAFLGATDGAPIRLRASEQYLNTLTDWPQMKLHRLEEAMRADVQGSGRSQSPTRLRQLRTCLSRSVMLSFGRALDQPELLA